jgi:tRNA (mo5U34)-methyltransferase
MKYLSSLPKTPFIDAITAEHETRQKWVNQRKKGFLRYREPCQFLSQYRAKVLKFDQDVVTIGSAQEISEIDRRHIHDNLRAFMPWRKGPFSVFGTEIDAEWRSERKWQRLVPELPDLKDKVVADIGCNNGYYMFRMVPYQPKVVIGFEPSVQHYYCFQSLRNMAGLTNFHIDLLGVEHIGLFPEAFDVIFLLGIIYHRPSPMDVLKDIFTALKPGGTLLLESQAIPGDEPIALFPEKTYAKVPGTYFVPTGRCLANWMQRAGFQQTKFFHSHPMSSTEQRRTEWMTFESYNDFIDPRDSSLTIEDYPAPCRVFLSGVKEQ